MTTTDDSSGTGDAVRRALAEFPGISSRAYEHPADRSALTALRKVPYADQLLKKMAGFFSERRLRLLFLASAARVDENQFPHLHRIRNEAAQVLDLPTVPELYVSQESHPNAFAVGIDHPFIVLTSESVDLYDEEELRFIIGHECGHILSGHAVYSSVLFALLRLSGVAIPLWSLALRGIVYALKEWYRKAELSCDRAGLLVVQDVSVATRTHLKMAAGAHVDDMDFQAFLRQGEEYNATGDARDGVARLLNMLDTTHPFAAVRAVELGRWVGSGDYDRVVAGDYPRREDDEETSFTEEVKRAAASYKESWDDSEDALIKTLRDMGGGAADLGNKVFDKVRDYVRPRSNN